MRTKRPNCLYYRIRGFGADSISSSEKGLSMESASAINLPSFLEDCHAFQS